MVLEIDLKLLIDISIAAKGRLGASGIDFVAVDP